jgi:PAS domain S-box-containing protein
MAATASMTARSNASADARQARERAAQIVAFATDAIISKDRVGVIVSWNLGAELLYGYRAEEVVGRSISLIIPEQHSGEESRLLLRVLGGERIDCYETTRLAKDGREVDVSLTLFALHDDSGRIVGAASIAHDISTQVAAQRELQHSEGLYRQILESTIEGVWNVNLELVTDYVNPSLARMLGYKVEEMLGRHLSEFLSHENLDGARGSIQRQSDGVSERLEQTFLCKDGSTIKVLMSVTAVFDGAGQHVGNMAIVTDVTQQRETETHLYETETFLAGLTASMQEGLLTLDADGRIVTVNRVAEQALGYQAAELIGQTLCASLGCEKTIERRCQQRDCPLTALSSTREPTRIDGHAFVRRDGTRLPVDLSSAPIGTKLSGPTERVVVFRDISERERAHEHAEHELEEMSWIGRVRDAMSEERMVLAAQPIVELATGTVCGQELLLRMRSRTGEIVMPSRFLPSAERFGLIGALDRWVIGQAADMAARGAAVNVNLSAQSLGDPELAGLIERLLQHKGANPALVTFEITETALTEHLDLASRLTFRLAALGCEFALDDFGTGYGAFTYLKTLPIKHLKIDIEFVRDLLQNEASQHLVSATVQLARSFGQKTVAEGVEDAQTHERLRELEVDYVQGYLLGRPEVVSFD